MSRLKLFLPLGIFVLLAALFWRGLSLDPTAMPSALIDKPLPAFQLPTVNDAGRIISERDLQGEITLLNVWATWCVACRVEHPFLNQLAEQGVRIVGVNYKDDVAAAQQWLQEFADPYVYSVVDADGRLGVDLGVFGAPETYVVDASGIIRYKHVGVVDQQVWDSRIQPVIQQLNSGQ